MKKRLLIPLLLLPLCTLIAARSYSQPTKPAALKGTPYMFCVGINNYLEGVNRATCGVCTERGIKNLNGCLNDVDTISKLFVKYYNFNAANIIQLRDQQASRAAILQTFSTLQAKCKKGDYFVFFYSGHGSYEYESKDDNQLRTGKGYRNTLVPADITKPGIQDLNSAELNKIFAGFTDKGVVVTVITDCCHSATNTRGSTFFEADTSREVKPSAELPKGVVAGAAMTRQLDQLGVLTLGSCQDNEIASEAQVLPNIYYGAFTISLCRSVTEWSQAPIDVLLDRTKSRLRMLNKLQTPNMEAARRKTMNLAGTAPAQARRNNYSLKCTDCSLGKLPVIVAGFTDDIMNGDILVDTKTKDSIQVSNTGLTETEVQLLNRNRKWKAADLPTLAFSLLKRIPNPDPPLRIYLGKGISDEQHHAIFRQASTLLQQNNLSFQWVNPFLQKSPEAVVFYRDGWKLNRNRVAETVGFDNPDAGAIGKLLQAVKINNAYLQLPPPASLVQQLSVRLTASRNRNILITSVASAADFMLAGHLSDDGNMVTYGWEKTVQGIARANDIKAGLPAVTDFFGVTSTGSFQLDSLADRARRLSVLANWLSMKSPAADPSMVFPFHLSVKNMSSRQKADDKNTGISGTEDKLDISIERDAGSTLPTDKIIPQFIYVMSMDPKGNTYLLYPQPRTSILTYPNSILYDTTVYHLATVRHTTPGNYHYFFMALREPVSSRDVFTRQGVVKGEPVTYSDNPLEALLNEEAMGQRGDIKSFDHWMLKTVDIVTSDKPIKK